MKSSEITFGSVFAKMITENIHLTFVDTAPPPDQLRGCLIIAIEPDSIKRIFPLFTPIGERFPREKLLIFSGAESLRCAWDKMETQGVRAQSIKFRLFGHVPTWALLFSGDDLCAEVKALMQANGLLGDVPNETVAA